MSIGAGRDDTSTGFSARPAQDVAEAIRVAGQRLFATEGAFVQRFSTSLVTLVPALEQLPDGQGRAMAEGLGRAVLWATLTDDPVDVVEATFQNIGSDYAQQGFPPEGYHGVGHALLRAARDSYTADWTSELSSGWVAFYGWLGAHLQGGARTAALPPAALPPTPAPAPAWDDARAVGLRAPTAEVPLPGGPSGPQSLGAPVPEPEGRATVRVPAPTPPTGALRRVPQEVAGATLTATRAPGTPSGLWLGALGGSGERARLTLDDVLDELRSRYFPADERALGAVLTRVTLRTGADPRAPRADQRSDPSVIADVLAVLSVMGYEVHPEPGLLDAWPVSDPPSRRQTRATERGDDTPQRGWRRAVPGRFR